MLGSRGVSLILNASGRRSRWRARRGKRGAVWPSVAFPSGRCRLLPSGPRVKLAAGVGVGAEMRHVGALLRFSVVRFLELRLQILVGCKTCFQKHFGSGTFTFIYV